MPTPLSALAPTPAAPSLRRTPAAQDPRWPGAHPELRASVATPSVLFQTHSAPLGLAFYTGAMLRSRQAQKALCGARSPLGAPHMPPVTSTECGER